jgi:peptidoglycan/xylan/chitin deacetylase (PgdA/CDA1 family)
MGIPILMYHEVGPIETVTERYTVPETMFRQQLQYLHDRGYQTISLEQYHDSEMEHGSEAGGGKVIITFDDNNLCHYSVSTPILLDFRCRATFFVVSGFIDTQPDSLSTAQLMEMRKAGMFIESHSHTHRFLNDLDHKELREELETSRGFLEDRLQTEVRFVSCPGGRYNRSVLDSALDVGYLGVCTSAPGLNEIVRGQPPKPLNRFLVSATTTLETFKKIVSGDKRFVRGEVLRHRAKGLVKELLGNERYDRLWRRYRKDL